MQKNYGYRANYGFEIGKKENLRQKKDGGSQTIDLDLLTK